MAEAEAEYQRGECHRLRGDEEAAALSFDRAGALDRPPEPGRALLLLASGRGDDAWDAVTAAVARSLEDPFRRARLLRGEVEIGVATGRRPGCSASARRRARRHLANIYLKLGVGSRTAAAAWAHEHGLVAPPPMSPTGRAGLS